jgi:hypothetical protein
LQYCQLLEAKVDFNSPGIYDKINKGTLDEKVRVIRSAMATGFSLHAHPYYTEDEESRKLLPPLAKPNDDAYLWAEHLNLKGVSGEDLQFLVEVLNPDPNARWTIMDILQSGHLEVALA